MLLEARLGMTDHGRWMSHMSRKIPDPQIKHELTLGSCVRGVMLKNVVFETAYCGLQDYDLQIR